MPTFHDFRVLRPIRIESPSLSHKCVPFYPLFSHRSGFRSVTAAIIRRSNGFFFARRTKLIPRPLLGVPRRFALVKLLEPMQKHRTVRLFEYPTLHFDLVVRADRQKKRIERSPILTTRPN